MAEEITLRRPRGSLESEEIVEAALAIVDRDGLAALTMRRLAGSLGIGVMTLYGHVRTKEELIERIAELAISELAIPATGEWDARLVELFRDLREVLLRHPSVLYADTVQPLIGTGALRAADAALGILRSGGIDDEEAVHAMSLLTSYTFGAAVFTLNRAGDGLHDYGVQVRGAHPDRLPNVVGLATHLLTRGSDEEFEFGLRLIVDGLRRRAEAGTG